MIVVSRYVVPEHEATAFLEQGRAALRVLAACRGHVAGRLGRATDDPTLWVLSIEWESVGAYRRALSSHEVKMHAVPLMYRALDEPSAFEVLAAEDDAGAVSAPTRRAADADSVAVGQASGPDVATGLG